MKINEHQKFLKEQIREIFAGATFGEYGPSECNGQIVRGPHVTLMVPAKDNVIKEGDFQKAVQLIDEHLCSVTWDGMVKCETHGGGIFTGNYYNVTMDIKSSE